METLFSQGLLGTPEGLAISGLVGLAFGFWLERAGFGSSRRLTDIFYFRDFAVFQVMFTAVVTASAGLFGLSALGLVDIDSIYRMETFLWPQIAGGAVLGAGFVVGGWCPGTAFVGLASGKLDALVFLLGVGGGILAYSGFHTDLVEFNASGDRGLSTLPDLLGLSPGITVGAVAAVALVCFKAISVFMKSRSAAEPQA
ncbi:YeeE/YedE thiosulfate transporter family protein [Saltatorellus ferox]